MKKAYSLQVFDQDYLNNLKNNLLPALQRRPSWINVDAIAENTEQFVEAVIALIYNGYFEDPLGYQRVELGSECRRIRFIPDHEIAMIEELKHEKSTTVPNS